MGGQLEHDRSEPPFSETTTISDSATRRVAATGLDSSAPVPKNVSRLISL